MAKKSKEFAKEIEIPADVEVKIDGNELSLKKAGNENKKRFNKILFEKKENKLIVNASGNIRREKKPINTSVAHIKNMLKGLNEKFVYKLQICAVHFPMNVSIKGNEIIIKNFLGEGKDRKARILEGVDVKISGEIITIESINKESGGQTAANIEKATKVRKKDPRVFQDGIFIIEKAGKAI